MTVKFILIKEDKRNLCRLHLRISVKGQTKDYSIQKSIYRAQWSYENRKVIQLKKGTGNKQEFDIRYILNGDDCREINAELNELIVATQRIERRCVEDKITYSAQDIITALRQSRSPKCKKEVNNSVYDAYLLIGDKMGVTEGTKKAYHSVMLKLVKYQKILRRVIEFKDLKMDFLNEFNNWMNIHENISSRTSAKYMADLKIILNKIVKISKLSIDTSYRDYVINKVDTMIEVVALTKEDYRKIKEVELSPKLEKVRDVFLFLCNTGLRYSDAMRLDAEFELDGFINLTTQKTKRLLEIPLVDEALKIFNRYKLLYGGLPKLGTSHFNKQLEKICLKAEISGKVVKTRHYGKGNHKTLIEDKYKRISSHTGRKTFISFAMDSKVPMTEIMAITGHNSPEMLASYDSINKARKTNTVSIISKLLNDDKNF